MKNVKVSNIKGSAGNPVKNQFIIEKEDGLYFQSYASVIAFIPFNGGRILLDRDKWDYSKTTGKYRNAFLGETKKETEAKIQSGEYELTDLN